MQNLKKYNTYGKYAGVAFYNVGGTNTDMKSPLVEPFVRPDRYDCAIKGKYVIFMNNIENHGLEVI